jgi:hypothetical protein
MLVSCLAYSSILKMEAICSSETLVDRHRTVRCLLYPRRQLFIATNVRTPDPTCSFILYVASQPAIQIVRVERQMVGSLQNWEGCETKRSCYDFEVLSCHLHRGTEENYEKHNSRQSVTIGCSFRFKKCANCCMCPCPVSTRYGLPSVLAIFFACH